VFTLSSRLIWASEPGASERYVSTATVINGMLIAEKLEHPVVLRAPETITAAGILS
jgi:hypothetical protein